MSSALPCLLALTVGERLLQRTTAFAMMTSLRGFRRASIAFLLSSVICIAPARV
jgi:hypothetical protein